MPEPSLSEFTNIATEADRGGGNPSIAIDTRDTAKGLQQAAIAKQQNDFAKYNLFLGNLKDIYKEGGEIANMEVMTQDRPELLDKMGKVFAEIAEDPKGTLGGARLADIQGKLAKLKFDATESKKNNLFDSANREYLNLNPDLNVPENKEKFEEFGNQKLGTRKPFTLDIPPVFDPYALAKLANETVKKDFADVQPTQGGKFFEKTSGTKYDKEQYKKVVDQAYDANTKLQQGVHRSFSGLPKDEQGAWNQAGGEKAWYSNFMQNLRSQDQTKKEDIKANEFALEALKNRDRIGLEYVKKDLKDKDKKEQARFLYDTYKSLINNTTGQQHTTEIGQTRGGKGIYSDSEEIINASPEILKLFSGRGKTVTKETGGPDKETETITTGETPDLITKTKDGGIRVVYYEKYTEDDVKKKYKGKRVGDVVTDSNGTPVQAAQSVVNPKEAAAIIGKDFIDKKDLGGALEEFNEAIDYGNSRQKQNQPKTYNVGGKTFTEDQLEKGAKKYKMTIEQYKSSIGVQ
jgi:hypothetical protein